MIADSVSLSERTVDALNLLDIGSFYGVMLPDDIAFTVLILRRLEDRPEWFPRGKWATIQEIERQLGLCADAAARSITEKTS